MRSCPRVVVQSKMNLKESLGFGIKQLKLLPEIFPNIDKVEVFVVASRFQYMPISTAQMAVVRLGKLLQSTLVLILSSYHFTSASSGINSFHESLTLHPTPDGKLSVLFEFTTYFTSPRLTSRIRERFQA